MYIYTLSTGLLDLNLWFLEIRNKFLYKSPPSVTPICGQFARAYSRPEWNKQCMHTQRNLFKILLNQTEIRWYLPLQWLIWNQTDVCLVLNQSEKGKYNLISIFVLTRFWKDFSACTRYGTTLAANPLPTLGDLCHQSTEKN